MAPDRVRRDRGRGDRDRDAGRRWRTTADRGQVPRRRRRGAQRHPQAARDRLDRRDRRGARLLRRSQTAGHALVADRFRRGRILLGGDAAHLFTPAGGLGYNTAVEDAVNLGWKLAAAVKGIAGPRLIDSYELERRPAAVRNTGYTRAFAESLGRFVPEDGLEDDGPRGERLRREAGQYLERHGRAEFNIPGITFGTRYAESPVIACDGSTAAPDAANRYEPSASPGGRAPHAWLDDGGSLFDTFGFEWTLLRLGPAPPDGIGLVDAARGLGIDLGVVDVPSKEVSDLYEAPLALVRPDQVVAWRGFDDAHADAVAAVAIGQSGDDEARGGHDPSREPRAQS